MNKGYILGIDQSTQGTKVFLVDENKNIIAKDYLTHKQIITSKGYVEHDPIEIINNTYLLLENVLVKSNIDRSKVQAIGITNQRETCLAWNKQSGLLFYNAIVWQCGRATKECKEALKIISEKEIKERTGLNNSPYFSAPKMSWLVKNVSEITNKKDDVCLGTIDSYLIYHLTNKKSFKTDYSNASRTMLFNINTLKWDDKICEAFNININYLPQVCFSDDNFGLTNLNGLLPNFIPIHSVMGDSHASLFAHNLKNKDEVKVTYGTGSSIMQNIGDNILFSNCLSTSIAYGINNKVSYVLEGNLNYTGAIISWLKNDLKLINKSSEVGKLASKASKKDETYLIPAFSGLGSPYFKSDAKAIICGMNRLTTKNEIAKAAEEAIAYQINDIIELLEETSKSTIKSLHVDGGAINDKFLMHFQSDITNKYIYLPLIDELSIMGVIYLAGLKVNLFSDNYTFDNNNPSYTPTKSINWINKKKQGYKKAISLVINSK